MRSIPSFISARELGKVLKKPLKEIVKKTCTRHHNKYYLKFNNQTYKFPKPGNVILPFDIVHQVFNNTTGSNNNVQHQVTEPTYEINGKLLRSSIIAVMGHVNHGKTTFMDSLRGSSIARTEKHGITQKVNVAEHMLDNQQIITFLDTPGHFHFHRMRNTASEVANAIVLIVAANEGIREQTIESIGCIDDVQLPTIVCVNKMDIASQQLTSVSEAIREYASLETCPIVPIVAKDPTTLKPVAELLKKLIQPIECFDYKTGGRGMVVEVRKMPGKGNVFRVLGLDGTIRTGDHFISGMTHGRIRMLLNMDGQEVEEGKPGRVVDVMFAQRTKIKDAPIEADFCIVSEEIAKQMIHEKLTEMEFHDAVVWEEPEEEEEDVDEEVVRRPVLIKCDSAGSIACIQDSVDELVRVVHVGLGDVNESDIMRAGNGECTIFGFNVSIKKREEKLAKQMGVNVDLYHTIHELVETIEEYATQPVE